MSAEIYQWRSRGVIEKEIVEEVGLELNLHVFINPTVEKNPNNQEHVPDAGRLLVIKVMTG